MEFVLSLIATAALYCAFPLIFSALIKKPMTKKRYTTVCFISNAVLCIAVNALYSTSSPLRSMFYAPYVLWTACFAELGRKILSKRGMLAESKKSSDGSEKQASTEAEKLVTPAAEQPEKSRSARYCLKCGSELNDADIFCRKCGARVWRQQE